jgi:hypothetical protein
VVNFEPRKGTATLTLRALAGLTTAAILVAIGSPALAQEPTDVLPEAPAKAIVLRACTSCHQPTVIVSKPHTADEWDEIIGKMMARGAELTDAEQDQVIAYLAQNFGPRAPGSPAAAPAPAPGGAASR